MSATLKVNNITCKKPADEKKMFYRKLKPVQYRASKYLILMSNYV